MGLKNGRQGLATCYFRDECIKPLPHLKGDKVSASGCDTKANDMIPVVGCANGARTIPVSLCRAT
jgi:hypothetical protein